MQNDAKLYKIINSVKGKKGIFSIILIAIVLTIIEISVFYFVVVPSIENEINTGVDLISDKIAYKINTTVVDPKAEDKTQITSSLKLRGSVFNDINENVLETISGRERKLTDQINNYTKLISALLMLCLIGLLIIVWVNIMNDERSENIDMTNTFLSTGIALVILIVFQILFYYFGTKYRFIGSMGDEEILYEIIKDVDANVEMDPNMNNANE